MNFKIISYFLGWVLKIEALALFLSGVVALGYGDSYWYILMIIAVATLLVGCVLSLKKFRKGSFYSREGYTATALGWLVMSLVGAIPFTVSGAIPHYVDAVFEIASGFTTTGASILNEVEHLGKGLLFFRSLSHWIGGMGVLVLILAILPFGGSGNHMQLMKAESPGPQVSKLVPRVRETALVLYGIYIGMTVVMIASYLISGMDIFDALCIGFGTAGTGGFTVRNDGMGSYGNASIWLIAVWTTLFAVNFTFYYLLLNKKWKEALKSEEVRVYFILVLSAILLIAGESIIRKSDFSGGLKLPSGRVISDNLREAAFTVGSTVSSTGYTLSTFSDFSEFGRWIVILLMFIGACGGSTGGGLKVSRVILLVKSARTELHMLVHPNAVKLLKFEGKTVDSGTVRSVFNYLVIFFLIFVGSSFILAFDPAIKDFTQNFTSVLTCLNNIGPAISGKVTGWIPSFGDYSVVTKIVLIFDMIAGRLELLPMLMLFSPKTWRKSN